MEKTDVILVAADGKSFKDALQSLNPDSVNVIAIIADSADEEFSQFGGDKIPQEDFSNIMGVASKYRNILWLLSGYVRSTNDLARLKKFLVLIGVPESNIINFDSSRRVQRAWLANLRYIEKTGADFFVTGNECAQSDLDFKFIPCGGVNLSYPNQDLRQSCMIAKHIFEVVKPGTIKFVLIGLTPESFHYDNLKDFANPRYQDARLMGLLSNEVKNLLAKTTADDADLNFEVVKKNFDHSFSIKAVLDWEDNSKPLPEDSVANNIRILKYYINLCLQNGAKPVGVIFPFAPARRETYNAELLASFYKTIYALEKNSGFTCVDLFAQLDYDCFCDMTHLNSKGMKVASSILALKLQLQNLLPVESFCDKSYKYFVDLSKVALRDEYNILMDRIFKASAQRISRKDTIKVGFVLYDASMWSGDDLYNFFAQDKRFEPTVFLCLRKNKLAAEDQQLIKKEFQHSLKQLKSHGLNVVALQRSKSSIPEQDILIYLTCFVGWLPQIFRLSNWTPKTLITYILYGLDTARHFKGQYNRSIYLVAWAVYFSSVIGLDLYKKMSIIGMTRGLFSGYSKMDVFFKRDANLHFDWKMTRPDAKKIIWAPHWSITGYSVIYATFQWNYKFMYEFARAHPETSWVVKPHPNLFFSAVKEKVFPSDEAFKKYLKAWDDLPNAQVYSGGYYQAVFATSDGMIHDSGSFIAEYQYMDKPMIYLTRNTQRFNKLGEEILKASYLVDGKDLEGIAALIKQIFIDGQDPKADKRRKIFDKYLNYPKDNGMLASEFIYKSIADELK